MHSHRGYTLIELLTAIALISVLAIWLYGGASRAFDNHMAGLHLKQAYQDVYALEMLRRNLPPETTIPEITTSQLLADFPIYYQLLINMGLTDTYRHSQWGDNLMAIAGGYSRVRVVQTSQNDIGESVRYANAQMTFTPAAPLDGEPLSLQQYDFYYLEEDPLVFSYLAKPIQDKYLTGL
ncbi:MAG: prepilin-type N-terminal cleavage/methylation domain-containing protein [Pseudomonadales bacterium]|nr:prepilin-type N-terminal cleavage/methylation domain-containing protein [Pseudomonadales bacterium]